MEFNFRITMPFKKRGLLKILMRTFIFLFCTLSFALSPNDGIGQNAIIKIETDQVFSVDDVFDLIEKQTDYNFLYSVGIFDDSPKVNLNKGKFRTFELLEKILKNTEFTYKIVNDAEIYLYKRENINTKDESVQVQIKISGIVKDSNGDVLPGVTVIEKGTNNGVAAGFLGNYEITVKDSNSILVFSFVGYQSLEVLVGNNTEINVVLKEAVQDLEAVNIISTV